MLKLYNNTDENIHWRLGKYFSELEMSYEVYHYVYRMIFRMLMTMIQNYHES